MPTWTTNDLFEMGIITHVGPNGIEIGIIEPEETEESE